MPIAYVLINSDLGTDVTIITKIKEMLKASDTGGSLIDWEIQGVYGVFDIILKLKSTDSDALRSIITNKIRKINNIQSTLTMTVIEKEEGS